MMLLLGPEMSPKAHMLSPQLGTIGKKYSLYEMEPTGTVPLEGITGPGLPVFVSSCPLHCEQFSLP